MTDRSKQERNQRALDALIVSQLRRHEDGDEADLEHLPRLTAEEKQALDSLGPDFIDNLLAGENKPEEDDPPAEEDELLCAGGMSFGMNRAEEIDGETAEELERKRQEIIERLKKKDGGDAQSNS